MTLQTNKYYKENIGYDREVTVFQKGYEGHTKKIRPKTDIKQRLTCTK